MKSRPEFEGDTADGRNIVKEREEWSSASKMNNTDNDALSVQQKRPDSPAPSAVSMKSDQSMREPIEFRDGPLQSNESIQQKRPDSPAPSAVSIKSSWSMREPIEFRDGPPESYQSIQPERPDSPSAMSMKSDWSMREPIEFTDGPPESYQSIRHERPDSPSAVSMKSDWSMREPIEFRDGPPESYQRKLLDRSQQETSMQSLQSHKTHLSSILTLLEDNVITFMMKELKRFKGLLCNPDCFESPTEDVDPEDGQQDRNAREGALKITLHILNSMNQKELADSLEKVECTAMIRNKLKSTLKKRFQHVSEQTADKGNVTLLNQIYTELCVTEGGSAEVNTEHEVRHVEKACARPEMQEKTIKCNNIFRHPPDQACLIRTVLTRGVPGVGKTISVQNFILDWALGKANQDVQFIFPLPFRELNLMKGEKLSLTRLIDHSIMQTKQSGFSSFDKHKVLFVFDGLDECQLALDFQNNESCWDVTESKSVDVLVTSLIKGNLLPSALIWITSRPAAANQIPSEYIDLVTEVKGFSDPQKEEYFRKSINDVELADRIIAHIKSSRSLYIMCHLPVFCWMSSNVLQRLLREAESGEIPTTLTQMYILFLVFQTKQSNLKYPLGKDRDPSHDKGEILHSLGKLAFQQLEKGNLIFYEEDFRECGIDVKEASVYSGLCTEIIREDNGLHQQKVYTFVHLSIQEMLAALYVMLTVQSNIRNTGGKSRFHCKHSETMLSHRSLITLHKHAVDSALASKNGDLDLFLRFLLGLSREANQKLLRGLLTQTRGSSQSNQKTVEYIKEKIKEDPSPDRCINLFHCLNELNDHSLVEEIQSYLNSGGLSGVKLSPAQWSALVFVLLTSGKDLDVFDLKTYSSSEEGLLRLLPLVTSSRKALMNRCNLTDGCCEALVRTLSSNSSQLRELDLSDNSLHDSGVILLSAGLSNPNCKLQTLSLARCNITMRCCEVLVSALCSTSSQLRELDLSDNYLQDAGVKILSAGLGNPRCRLKTLRLSFCGVTQEGCTFLASALKSDCSRLKELDLSYNHPGDSGVSLLSAVLEDPQCKLKKLSMEHGGGIRLRQDITKYTCKVTLDPNTAHRRLSLSEGNEKVSKVKEEQPYPEHIERFEHMEQVLCREGLTGRSYWEAEWKGKWVVVGMAYRSIARKGFSDTLIGCNHLSWGLTCSEGDYIALNNNIRTAICVPSSISKRIGVYLDWPAGTLSFYRMSSVKLTHLHTFHATFTEPLYPGFWVPDHSSVSLSQAQQPSVPWSIP